MCRYFLHFFPVLPLSFSIFLSLSLSFSPSFYPSVYLYIHLFFLCLYSRIFFFMYRSFFSSISKSSSCTLWSPPTSSVSLFLPLSLPHYLSLFLSRTLCHSLSFFLCISLSPPSLSVSLSEIERREPERNGGNSDTQ